MHECIYIPKQEVSNIRKRCFRLLVFVCNASRSFCVYSFRQCSASLAILVLLTKIYVSFHCKGVFYHPSRKYIKELFAEFHKSGRLFLYRNNSKHFVRKTSIVTSVKHCLSEHITNKRVAFTQEKIGQNKSVYTFISSIFFLWNTFMYSFVI